MQKLVSSNLEGVENIKYAKYKYKYLQLKEQYGGVCNVSSKCDGVYTVRSEKTCAITI